MEQGGRKEQVPMSRSKRASLVGKQLRQINSDSSSSSQGGLLNPPPIRNRNRKASHLSQSDFDGDGDRAGPTRQRASHFPRAYEYEWHEPSFFGPPGTQPAPPLPPPVDAPRRAHQTVEINAVKTKMNGNIMLIEVAGGAHQLVEVSPSEILHRVRHHQYSPEKPAETVMSVFSRGDSVSSVSRKQGLGDLTYRDIRQVFTDGYSSSSVEVRRNCIVVSLPSVTAIVLHDRCVFMVNDNLDCDKLLVKLEEITAQYAKHAEKTRLYYQTGNRDLLPVASSVPGSPGTVSLLSPTPEGQLRPVSSRSNMLFGAPSPPVKPPGPEDEKASKVPRFVSFPLEFALLEVLLATAFEDLQVELAAMEETLDRVERRVTKNSPSSTRLEVLHSIKAPCQQYSDTVTSVVAAFKDLLANPEDMRFMELTRHYYRPDLYNKVDAETPPNADLEVMLEFYGQEATQFERRTMSVLRSIDNAEKLLTLRMMLTRNSLVYYELAGTVLTTFLNVGTCISSIFGMNLVNGGEESYVAFLITTAMITLVVIVGIIVVTWMVLANKM